METELLPDFLTVHRLKQYGISTSWLRREARAGRIPFVRIGRRLWFSPKAVERTLLEHATEKGAR